jgi:hypothetical protein
MRAELFASRIEEFVAGWPPLSLEQRNRLAVLLLGGERPSAGEESSP